MKKSTLSARLLNVVCGVVCGIFFAAYSTQAQEVSITPPPLAYPDFSEPGTTQGKVTGTYMSISGEGFDMTGLGVSYTGRTVLDNTPDDLGQGVGYAGAALIISGSDFGGVALAGLGNYERELYDQGPSNVIGFGGPNITYGYVGSDAYDIEFLLFGIQLGVQYSHEADDLVLSPFFMYVTAGGSVWVDGVEYGTDTEATLIGFDLLLVSKGITLSGILQESFGDSSSDSLILQVSYSFGPQAKDSQSGTTARRRLPGQYQSAGGAGDPLWAQYRGR